MDETPVASPASETATPPSTGGVSAESRPASQPASVGSEAHADPPTTAEIPTNLRDALRDPSSATGVLARRGPIPYDRHEAILKKQREDAAAERAAFLGRYNGLDRMSPEQWGQVTGLMTDLANSPLDTIGRILDELGSNPATARQLQGWVAQRFPLPAATPAAAEREQPAARVDDDPMPPPDADGGYTQDGLAKLLAWQSRRTIAEMSKANAPLQAEIDRMRSERATRDLVMQANDYATNLLTEVSTLPGFKEHQAAIKDKFRALRFPRGTPNGDITAALYRCYLSVVVPTLAQSAKQDVLSTLDHKAKATTTSPGARTAAAPKAKPMGLREALAAEFAPK